MSNNQCTTINSQVYISYGELGQLNITKIKMGSITDPIFLSGISCYHNLSIISQSLTAEFFDARHQIL
jgi:hypothetical protein